MTKYFFNWNDLLIKSKKDNELIIILTYASIIGYNKKIAASSYSLLHKLNINRIPSSKFLKKKYGVISTYKLTEPQSYFTNAFFLTANVNIIHKVNYLFILSNRRIDDDNKYINKDIFVNIKEFYNNPFIHITENKIKFIFE